MVHEHGITGRPAPRPRPGPSAGPRARARPRPAARDGRRRRRSASGCAPRSAQPMQISDDTLDVVLSALLAGGHLLLEDRPGVGKTQLARTLAGSVDGRFARVQATVDLLPTDILGATVWHAGTETFEFHPGPVFANVVLVDELNRATPKTQSGLLEAMQELQVTARRPHPPARAAVHGDRDAEPERRLRRHLPPAARAARPVPRARVARLPDATRRRSRCCASRRAAGSSAPGRCASCSPPRRQVEEVRASEALLGLRRRRARGDPPPPAQRDRREPARRPAAARRRARPRGAAGPRLRAARRRPGARRARARAPHRARRRRAGSRRSSRSWRTR